MAIMSSIPERPLSGKTVGKPPINSASSALWNLSEQEPIEPQDEQNWSSDCAKQP